MAYILQDDSDIVRLSTLCYDDMKSQIPMLLRIQRLIRNNWIIMSESAIDVVLCYDKSNYVLTGHFVDSSIERSYGSLISFDDLSLEDWQNTFKDNTTYPIIVLPLSKAILAVLSIYSMVGHWNACSNGVSIEKQSPAQ